MSQTCQDCKEPLVISGEAEPISLKDTQMFLPVHEEQKLAQVPV